MVIGRGDDDFGLPFVSGAKIRGRFRRSEDWLWRRSLTDTLLVIKEDGNDSIQPAMTDVAEVEAIGRPVAVEEQEGCRKTPMVRSFDFSLRSRSLHCFSAPGYSSHCLPRQTRPAVTSRVLWPLRLRHLVSRLAHIDTSRKCQK
jgi:hypothetical protein